MTELKHSGQFLDRSYLIIPILFGMVFLFMFWGMPAWMHSREHLQRDYEEVFATPYKDVQVSEYWNENVGHGTRFRVSLTSVSPLKFKDPAAFKEVPIDSFEATHSYVKGGFLKTHPWVTTIWYREQPLPGQEPGAISVYLNQAKDRCEVRASKAGGKWPTKRNGERFTVSKASEIEFSHLGESYLAYSKKIDHNRIAIEYPGSINIAVSTKSLDLRLDPNELYQALLSYLRELEAYNGTDVSEQHRIKDKLLNLEVSDGAISDEQVAILDKLATEVKDYNSHLPAGTVPIRLKVIVAIVGTDSRGMLKHPK
jgi:hypothetical protein